MNHSARQQRLRALLEQEGLDALLVTDLINVRYLAGFTGSLGTLLLSVDGERDVFVTDGRYTEQAASQVQGVEVAALPGPGWLRDRLPTDARLGLEDRTIAWAQVQSLERELGADSTRRLVPASGLVEGLRQIKDADEVAALTRAAGIADNAFAQLLPTLEAGTSERTVAVTLDRLLVDGGADAPSFDTIVAAGANGAKPHHRPSEAVLQRGDLVVLDFGALVDGYHSDMTRMVALGQPAPDLVAMVDAVAEAQAAGVRSVAPGVQTSAVDAACREVIAAHGFTDRFVHGTGHGVGLQIHEDPYLRPLQPGPAAAGPSSTLREQMTVTVEPGVYVPGRGGVRIEDSLVVTPDGAEILTTTPKELVIL